MSKSGAVVHNRIGFRKVRVGDMGFLYRLLRERPKGVSISHTHMPTFAEHCRFWKRKPYRIACIITVDKYTPVGYAYLTDRMELGIHISIMWRSRGIGTYVVRKVLEEQKGKDVYMNVGIENGRAARWIERMGGNLVQFTYWMVR
jgi:predicted acetyltransferase